MLRRMHTRNEIDVKKDNIGECITLAEMRPLVKHISPDPQIRGKQAYLFNDQAPKHVFMGMYQLGARWAEVEHTRFE